MNANLEELSERVRAALEAGDLDAYQDLLDPDVHWGPADEPEWGCRNRRQVLTWYKAARDKGTTATVTEVLLGTDCILVGLSVSRPPAADELDAAAPRWQVLAVKDGRIVDIAGFDDRSQAAARAGIAN